MFNRFGGWEIVIILVVVLIIFGAGKLPQVGSAIGKGIRNFRKGQSGEVEEAEDIEKEKKEGSDNKTSTIQDEQKNSLSKNFTVKIKGPNESKKLYIATKEFYKDAGVNFEKAKEFLSIGTTLTFENKNDALKFVEKYKNDLLPKIVITIHIEHIGKEYLEKDGKLVATGYPEPRGIFISDNPSLFSLVKDVVIKYDLQRLLIFPTDNPLEVPTDGAPFYWEKLPIISLASAPVYIYNPIDTIEKLAIEEFEPVTKAFIDIIQSIDKMPRKDLRIN